MEPSKTGYYPVLSHTEIVDLSPKARHKSGSWQHYNWRASESIILKTAGYVSVGIVPLTLALWLPRSLPDFRHFDIFQSVPLGGSLTLNQAKAIDFVSSAVFAPLILGILNYVWFANARVSIADERKVRTEGTSLYALVEASSISAGTYDLVKLWTLSTSKSIHLVVFAIMTLAAALGKSSLSNIIAYEAFKLSVPAAPVQLRLLTGPYMSSYGIEQTSNNSTWSAMHDQRKDFVQGTTEVLQGIAWQNSTSMLTSGAFITLNVTSWELGQLDSSIIALYNVPAINATIECHPHSLTSLQLDLWTQTDNNGFTLELDEHKSLSNSKDRQPGWSADVPASLAVFQDGANLSTRSLDFLAYSNGVDDMSIYVGSMGSVQGKEQHNWTIENTQPVSSSFGQIEAQSFNISANGTCADGNNCTMLIWGITCTVNQRQGFVNLTRASADQPWNKSSMVWSEDTVVRPSELRSLARELGTQSFKAGKAGLGPALTPAAETCNTTALQDINDQVCSRPGPRHLDYQTLAHNLLWAEMAVQTVAYETGAMNASLATPEMFINVASTASVSRYRMTYVPTLLLGGLIFVFLAASISASLLAYTAKTVSGQQYRYVDSLRLLVDCVVNLQYEGSYPDARSWSNQELETWAKNFIVRYEAHGGHDTDLRPSTVVLTAVTKPVSGDSASTLVN